jgi:hypothetical protein
MKNLKKFDILLILIVLAMVGILALKFVHLDSVGIGGDGVEYNKASLEIVIEDVRIMSAEAFRIGDELLSDDTNHRIGVIKDVQIQAYEKTLEKSDGSLVLAQVPEKYKVVLTVETELSERETGYFAYGVTEIKNNSATILYTKYVKSVSKVEAIRFED